MEHKVLFPRLQTLHEDAGKNGRISFNPFTLGNYDYWDDIATAIKGYKVFDRNRFPYDSN